MAAVETNTLVDSGSSRKIPGRTTIAHISDLHFTSRTEPLEDDKWKALSQDVYEHADEIDLILATGDIIDGSVRDTIKGEDVRESFQRANRFLDILCEASNISNAACRVVPGNHDTRIKGILASPLLQSLTMGMLQKDIFLEIFEERFQPTLYPGLRACVFPVNSNDNKNWRVNAATGFIRQAELVNFRTIVNEAEQTHKELDDATRIVMLHHHPMPIPFTELDPTILDTEELHLLKNAGLFMQSILRSRVELVLHGHKHFPSFSRASFPVKIGDSVESRELSVVGAGSVGQHGRHPLSYNLVRVHDTGGIEIRRRIREGATYSRGHTFVLDPYEIVRRKRFERLGLKASDLRLARYVRTDYISSLSGDDEIEEMFVGTTAVNEPVRETEVKASSASGYFSGGNFESSDTRITMREVPSEAGTQRIVFGFDPPIAKRPVTFRRTRTIHNAFQFNQRDRLQSSDFKKKTESVRVSLPHMSSQLVHHVIFPPMHFPEKYWVKVDNARNESDEAEESFARSRLSAVASTGVLTLAVENPLPGFRYRIEWDLPVDEAEELNLSASARGKLVEIRRKLLSVGQHTEEGLGKDVVHSLVALKQNIEEAGASLPTGRDETLEFYLRVHDPDTGLVCVAGLGNEPEAASRLPKVIPVGKAIAGQACKRRENLFVSLVSGAESSESVYDEPLEDWESQAKTAEISIPLYYPMNGARVGVLSVVSRSHISWLLPLTENENEPSQGSPTPRDDRIVAFVTAVTSWYDTQLLPMFGVTGVE